MNPEAVYSVYGSDLNARRFKRPPDTFTGGRRRLRVYGLASVLEFIMAEH